MSSLLLLLALCQGVIVSVNSINNPAFARLLKRGSSCQGSPQVVTVGSKPGFISTPGYPHHFYPSNSLCQWNLTAPLQKRIHITSEIFELEDTPSCLFDHLLIYDGPNDKAEVVGSYCGSETVNVVTSSNHVFLVFFSDMSYENRGFKIKYERTSVRSTGGKVVRSDCNATLINDKSYVASPDFPLPYPSIARCSYILQAPADNIIQIVFKHFTLEHDKGCDNDFLAIYDGKDRDTALLGRYCGNNYPESLRSSGNLLHLYFESDEYFELGGFNLTYRFLSLFDQFFLEEMGDKSLIISGDADCSGIKEDSKGAVTTPSYPHEYSPLKKCIVIVRAPVDHVIRLTFNDFLLEDSQDCEFDWLRILDGEKSDSPVVGRYCSDTLENVTINSRSQIVRLEFQSDLSVEYKGFRADYRIVKNVRDCPLKCTHAGICKEDEDGQHCACPTGWGGRLCHLKKRTCADKPCIHGGVCSRTPLSYRCQCSKKYEGKHCESRTSLRFTSKPKNSTAKQGEKVFLECGTNNDADIIWTYEDDVFFEEGGDIAIFMGVVVHRGGVLEITSFAQDNAGKYTCSARSETERISTDSWIHLNRPCPNMIQSAPSNATVLQDSTHHFTCVAIKGVQIAWERNDLPLVSNARVKMLINGMLILDHVNLQDAGKYTCLVRGTSGCIKRYTAWLTVRRHDNLDEVCGRVLGNKPSKGRITEGTLADEGAHPWYVLLRNPPGNKKLGASFCGASVINRRWVVTAAHCVLGRNRRGEVLFGQDRTRLYIGTNDCTGKGGIEAKIEKVVTHPEFQIRNYDNDIALLKLDDTLQYTRRVMPVCLKPKAFIQAQFIRRMNFGLVVGCGSEIQDGYGAKKLMKVKVPLRSRAECQRSTNSTVTSGMLCAGYKRATRGDSCQGDSGGPFVMEDEHGVAILVGIVSWGEGCDRAGKYGYYTNIGKYYNWINEKLVEFGEL